MEFTINVQVSGDYTEEDLKQYLLFSMGFGSCPQDNPFIDEDSDAEVSDVEFV
jgi:hypothetical protein